MQSYTPRPMPQPIRRQTGSFATNQGRAMRVPQRGTAPLADPVGRAMLHRFEPSPTMPPRERHAHSPVTSAYAGPTQALFAAPAQNNLTPYQQAYHYDPLKQQKQFHFPFRTLMVLLVVGAMAFGAFAIHRAFTQPLPVNAEPTSLQELTP